jgi:hypothetical protein
MPATSIPITEAARLLDLPEGEVEKLAGPPGVQVSLETVRSRAAEERLMLMERIEKELEESSSEV